ncbi:MAG: hypothetical protein IPM71_07310 [Bacteroidota bacterium]|nr:MAG: hypothetical protein IPM71_07310 [Bacteroidota bacterium]
MFYLSKGDSIQFFDNIFVGGGIPPIEYYWTPSKWLDDSARINAWCKPLESTEYSQYIIDSAGCNSGSNTGYFVFVNPTSAQNIHDESENQLNLQQHGNSLVFNNPHNKRATFSIYTIDGKKIVTSHTTNSHIDISSLIDNGSMIICVLSMEGVTTVIKAFNIFEMRLVKCKLDELELYPGVAFVSPG